MPTADRAHASNEEPTFAGQEGLQWGDKHLLWNSTSESASATSDTDSATCESASATSRGRGPAPAADELLHKEFESSISDGSDDDAEAAEGAGALASQGNTNRSTKRRQQRARLKQKLREEAAARVQDAPEQAGEGAASSSLDNAATGTGHADSATKVSL